MHGTSLRPGRAARLLAGGAARVTAGPAEVATPTPVVMGGQDPDFPDPTAEADWIARTLHAEVVTVPRPGIPSRNGPT